MKETSMKKRLTVGAGVVVAALALTGCGGTSGAQGSAEAEELIIYSSRAQEITDYVVDAFEEEHPEYEGKVQVVNLGAGDIPERVRAESANPQASLWWGGTQQNLATGVEGDLLAAWPDAPFAEDIDDAFKDPEGRWYAEYQLPQVIVYNSDVLSQDEAPQDWDELVDEKWEDKVVIRDVAPSGGMRSIFDAMILRESPDGSDPEPGYDYLRALDANTVTYAADPADLYTQLSRQAGVVTAWNLQDTLIQINENKMPFDFVVPQGGTPVLVDGLGIINGAPNEEGAKLFAEFLFDAEVRQELADSYYQIPVTPIETQPAWMEGLDIEPLDVDWSVAAQHEADWIDYWSTNIKNKG
jgi:iron(III) transport system substrate-binding protein